MAHLSTMSRNPTGWSPRKITTTIEVSCMLTKKKLHRFGSCCIRYLKIVCLVAK